jgi:hypothetical protein
VSAFFAGDFLVAFSAADFLPVAFVAGDFFLRVGVAVAGDFLAAFSAADFLADEPCLPVDSDAMRMVYPTG